MSLHGYLFRDTNLLPDPHVQVVDEAERWIDEVLGVSDASPREPQSVASFNFGALEGCFDDIFQAQQTSHAQANNDAFPGWSSSPLPGEELNFHGIDLAVIESTGVESTASPQGLIRQGDNAPSAGDGGLVSAQPGSAPAPMSPEVSCTGESHIIAAAHITDPQQHGLNPGIQLSGECQRVVAPSVGPATLHPPENVVTPSTSGSGGQCDVSAIQHKNSAQSRESHMSEQMEQQQRSGSEERGGIGTDPLSGEDYKRSARQQRNRESAAQSRVRKKKYFEDLESRCQALERANAQLNAMVQQLCGENAALKCQLASAYSGQQGAPVPAFGTPLGVVSNSQVGYFTSAPPPVVKVPIPASKAPLKRKQPVSQMGKGGKAKQSKAAVPAAPAVLLSVVCCLMLVSSPYWGASPSSNSMTLPPRSGASMLGDQGVRSAGRVLASVESMRDEHAVMPTVNSTIERWLSSPTAEGSEKGSVQGSPRITGEDVGLLQLPSSDHSTDWMSKGGDETEEDVKVRVLQQLKRLGPLALTPSSSLPPWLTESRAHEGSGSSSGGISGPSSFPMIAGNVFANAGLVSPVMCTEILRFRRAEEVEGDRHEEGSRPAADVGERPASVSSSFPALGRKSFAIPLPPAGTEPRSGTSHEDPTAGPKQRIGDEDANPPAPGPSLVSVLLPQRRQNRSATGNATKGEWGGSWQLDLVYVVVLEPESSYVTYKCNLPESVQMRGWQSSSL